MSSGDFDEEAYREAGYIVASGYRQAVCDVLADGPATPKGIGEEKESDKYPHYSRALGELEERDVIELLSPEDTKKGRIYGLTDHGAEVWELAQTINNGGD